MTWTDPDLTQFNTGDVLTEPNLDTYVLNNLLSLDHVLLDRFSGNVQNTTTETNVLSTTVLANTLGNSGAVVVPMEGFWVHNATTTDSLTLRVKFGGVTQIAAATTNNNALGAGMAFSGCIVIANTGATNAQTVYLTLISSNQSNTQASTGLGSIDGVGRLGGCVRQVGAVDTTANQALVLSAQWSAASANNQFTLEHGRVLIGRN